MSKLSRLQARLVRVQARIEEIETAYPTILNSASSSDGETSFANQGFEGVARTYERLLETEETIQEQIDALSGDAGGGCSVATFQSPSATA